MVNNSNNNNKLDQAIKQTLANFEASYNANDWAQMESLLNVTPQSNKFKWTYVLTFFIGVTILVGFYLLFNSINFTKTSEKLIDSIPQHIIDNSVTPSPVVTHPLPITAPTEIAPTDKKNIKSTETEIVKENKIAKNETSDVEKKENKKENIVKEHKEKSTKKQPILKMEKESVLVNMVDSSKKNIEKIKEKEEIKQADKTTQSDHSIGWSSFISKNNLDSLKKYHEQQQRDSLKK